MLASAIIVFRETLEAALLIGIVAAASRAISGRARWIAGGILAGALGAGIVALLAGRIALLFEGMGQELFNAAVLALAIILLGWHQIWMSVHSKELSAGARQIAKDVHEGRRELSAVLVVIALAVLREGTESVLFLYGLLSGGDTSKGALLSGGLVGLLAGAALGMLLYAGMLRIPMRWFFSVVSALVLLLAAGMASKMTQLLVQADLLPSLVNPLWDTSSVLPRESMLGVLMHALAGYEPRPAGMQVVSYALTVAVILAGMWLARRPAPVSN
jgi:high-affinity iron transporter